MKHPQVYRLIAAMVALALASCASAPQAPPPPPPAEPSPAAQPSPVPAPAGERQQARELRATVERYGLAAYAAQAWQEAERQREQGESLFDRENEKSRSALQEAVRGYRLVLDTGFPLLAAERQSQARQAKGSAEEAMAQVALKDAFAEVQALYEQAASAAQAKDYARAVDLFAEVQPRFEALAGQAREKKARAEQALLASRESIQRAERQAEEAEKTQGTIPQEATP